MNSTPEKLRTTSLRQAAEARLRTRSATQPTTSEADWRRLQHELEVQHLELEIQNEELQAAQAVADQRYAELYDFAPVSYFNLTTEGKIHQVNLTGAKLIGVERARLLGRPFELLVTEPDRSAFGGFLRRVFATGTKQNCDVRLLKSAGRQQTVHVDATPSPAGDDCRLMMFEITERKREELALRTSEDNFRQLTEAITDVFWIASPDLQQMQYVSPGYERIWGRTAESLYAHPHEWIEAVLPEDRERVASDFASLRATELVVSTEYRIARPDGTLRWILDRGFQVRDAAGQVRRVTGVARDITEHKLAEQALLESRNYAQTLLAASPIAIVTYKPSGETVSANEAAAKLIGTTLEKVKQQNFRELASWKKSNLLAMAELALVTGKAQSFESHFVSTFGVEAWTTCQFVPFQFAGGPHLMLVADDITERKALEATLREREAQLRLYAEHSPAAIAMFDRGMKYLVASQRWLTDFHLDGQNIIGRSHYELFPDLPARWLEIHRCCLAGATEKSDEDVFQRADGATDYIRWEVRPWFQADGAIGGIIIFSEVITARIQAEQRQRESQERYVLAERATQDGLWDWNLLTDAEYFSPRWKEIIGLQDVEIPGHKSEFLQRVHPEDLPRVQAMTAEHLAANRRYEVEFRLRHQDGSYRWVFSRGQAVRDAAGRPVRMVGSTRDITEHKQFELKMEDARQRLKLATEASALGIWEWHVPTNRVSWDDQMFRLYGVPLTADGMVDFSVWRGRVLPEDLPHQEAVLHDTVRRAGSSSREFRILRADNGQCRYLQAIETVRVNAQGQSEWVLGTNIDITERKLAEEALKEREAIYAGIVNQAVDSIALVDLETGRYVEFNPAAYESLGYSREEFAHFGIGEIQGDHSPEQIRQTNEYICQHGSLKFESRHRHRDGTLRDVSVSTRYLGLNGRRYIAAIWSDITERKQAERLNARLAAIVESSSDAIISKDRAGIVQSWNQGAEVIFGYRAEEIIGTSIRKLIPVNRQEEEDQILQQILAGHSVSHFETIRLSKAGRLIPVSITVSPIKDHAGTIIGASKLIRDITESKRTERALKTISACDQVLVHATSEPELLQKVCRVIIEQGGYRLAWVGFAENDEARSIRVAAFAGHEAGYLSKVKISWSEAEECGRGPTGIAMRTRQTAICQDMRTDPNFAPWRAAAAAHGYASSMTLPLLHAGESFGVLAIYAAEAQAFQPAEVALLTGLSDDLGYGIQALRTLQERLQAAALLEALVRSSPDAILVVSQDGKKVIQNRRVAELWRIPQPIVDDPDDQAQYAFAREQAKDPATFDATSLRLVTSKENYAQDELELKDGRILARQTALVRDTSGTNYGRVWVFRDITERKQAEAQIRRLTVFPELNPNPVLEFSANGALTYHNQAALDLSRALDLTGVPALLPPHVDELVRQCLATNRPQLREEIVRGSHILSASFYPIRKANTVHCYMGDITERKRAEDQLQVQISALTATANAIVITARNGDIEWVNPSFTKLTGYSAEEVIGQNPRLLKSGEHSPTFYGTLWATILTGNVWHGDMINKRKDGRLYTSEMTITPVQGADGQIAHFVAVKQDITERRQMEKRMLQAQKMEAIGTLAGGIAHDFNNMLAAMFGYAHLLQQDTVGNPLAQESVAEILTAANRAKELVQQILSFSRQREQQPQVLKLDMIIKEVVKFLRASLPAHIKIEKELAAETPAVLADPTQIYQVIMNLATNSLHAMEDEPGRLLIRLDPVRPDAALRQKHQELKPILYVRLVVADTGHGMDAKTQERIFEPFFTTKPVGKGTGLGLAVVHGIVDAHHGVITVDSQVGQGTTFTLYFPAETKAEAPAGTNASAVPHGHGQQILVLDDETALTAVLQKMLHRLDYQVTTSNQASEAIYLGATRTRVGEFVGFSDSAAS